MLSDFTTPTRRDTFPSPMTQIKMDEGLISTVPAEISRRFKRLAHLYQLSCVNSSRRDNSAEQFPWFEI